jgi:endonuclease/exonuclease/phosphatase family metal-dependent hydrolase
MRKIILILFSVLTCSCNEPVTGLLQSEPVSGSFRIMFWNAENLFDCYNDSLVQDEEFLPYGIRTWTNERYHHKLNKLSKVFISAGEWEPPEIIGLCEVENSKVLLDLLRETPFSYFNYRFVQYDSPDRRGIDVALLYDPLKTEIITSRPVPVKLPGNSSTRDILYVRLRSVSGDTLSVYVNHWPSKYGGAGISESLRSEVAETLSSEMSTLISVYPHEKVVIMGDFNDTPESNPLMKLLNSFKTGGKDSAFGLINLASGYKGEMQGSIKFEGTWELIDQIIISRALMSDSGGLYAKPESFRVYSPEFLLENDEKYGGQKPFRTYSGFAYHGGYSDHLPVILDLYSSQ